MVGQCGWAWGGDGALDAPDRYGITLRPGEAHRAGGRARPVTDPKSGVW